MNGISNPLELAAPNAYRWSVGSRGSPAYNFLGVKYVLAAKEQPPGDATLVRVFEGDPEIDVYLNTQALPRVLLVHQVRLAPNGEAAFEAIHSPEFDPAREAVIESLPSSPAPALPGNTPQGDRFVAFRSYGANSVDLIARTPAPAYLVLSDAWYPGWEATGRRRFGRPTSPIAPSICLPASTRSRSSFARHRC
jgi:hypothetical protein